MTKTKGDLNYVAGLEMVGASYEFSHFDVYFDGENYWTGTDSGCSCPTPFENHTFPEDYTGPLTWRGARGLLDAAYYDAPLHGDAGFLDSYRAARQAIKDHALENPR